MFDIPEKTSYYVDFEFWKYFYDPIAEEWGWVRSYSMYQDQMGPDDHYELEVATRGVTRAFAERYLKANADACN